MNLYFIAILLPQHFDEQIKEYKQWMLEQFKCKVGLKSPAHITLLPPNRVAPENEKLLINMTKEIAENTFSFNISTNNFSSFGRRTLFIDVVPNKTLSALKEKTNERFSQQKSLGLAIDRRPFHPHITIATRDISATAFEQAWDVFRHKNFTENFTASGLSLLRHNGKAWDVLDTAPFNT